MKLTLSIGNADELLTETDRFKMWENGGSIGRSDENDWVLPDPRHEISRVHARVFSKGSNFYIEDLSTNGVFINSRDDRIDGSPYEITNGDTIFIGHYQIYASLENISNENQSSVINQLQFSEDAAQVNQEKGFTLNADLATMSMDTLNELDTAEPFNTQAVPSKENSSNVPFIPEDWSGGQFSSSSTTDANDTFLDVGESNTAVDMEIKAVILKELNIAQEEALMVTLTALLDNFDQDYVSVVMSKTEGGKEKLFRDLYEKAFLPHLQSLSKN